jgi:hypothetical protein
MARGRVLVWASCLLGAALCQPLSAQQPATAGTEIFPADYFAAAHPADAYDMVRKLPGFELIDIDDEVRGFAGSRGNVLFDGRVPSGKQETLEQMLRRIPASSVLRIELIRGGAGATATGGFSMVANIVRRTETATSYSVLAGLSAAPEIGARPDFRLEMSNQRGGRRFEGALALETDIDDDSGKGAIVERHDDGTVEREDRDEREVQRTLSADAEYKFPGAGGELVGNASLDREKTSERILTREEDSMSLALEQERVWNAEAGVQYNTDLGAGELEGLVVHRRSWLRSLADEDDESFAEKTRTSESVGRLEYRRGSDRLRHFASVEVALNSLDGEARLTEAGIPVPIPGSDANVAEKRAEAAIGSIWKPRADLVVEPSLRAEISNIKARGDSPSNESFLFIKPRLRVTWDGGRTRLQGTIEREAAQLDFQDFVASAELDRDDILAGAKSLRPPTTWSVSALIERKFWNDGSLTLTYRREWIDDVIDRVVIDQDGDLSDAVGNIGRGKRRVIKAELTAPFARLGLPGAQLKASLTFLKSRVTDPVTGERRSISEDRPFEGDLNFTDDLPGGRWSWGVDASLAHREREFRFDEIREERKETSLGAFVEYRPAQSWRARLEAENLTSRTLADERDKFDGLRSSGILDSIETRRIKTAPIFSLSVRKSFGAAGN